MSQVRALTGEGDHPIVADRKRRSMTSEGKAGKAVKPVTSSTAWPTVLNLAQRQPLHYAFAGGERWSWRPWHRWRFWRGAPR